MADRPDLFVLSCYPVTPSKDSAVKPVVFVRNGANLGEVCFYCKKEAKKHLVDNEHETPICQKCYDEREFAIKKYYCLKKLEIP